MHTYSRLAANDRYTISARDENKIESLAQKLDYPIEDILRAVQEVGFGIDEVAEYIRDRENRC